MAPEFFPFIAWIGLAVIALAGLCVGTALAIWAYYSKRQRRVLRVLSAVTFSGTVVILLVLLVLGAKIRQQFFLNEPFVSACRQGDLAEAQRLLSRGASPDAYGVDYIDTALIAATRGGHPEIVALLLRSGANVALQDDSGKTALDYAKGAGDSNIVSMLGGEQKPH